MKNIFVAIVAAALTLTACSSGSGKADPAPNTPQGGVTPNGPLTEPFDKDAFGNWVTKDCFQMPNAANSTARIILTIYGNGKASEVVNVFASADCSGAATPQPQQDITYTIDRYANGGGQITVQGQPIDVTISNGHLTLSSASGTQEFLKQ